MMRAAWRLSSPRSFCSRRCADVDLALIRLVGKTFVRPPTAQVCVKDDRWRTPNRPTPADPHLNGAVDVLTDGLEDLADRGLDAGLVDLGGEGGSEVVVRTTRRTAASSGSSVSSSAC